MSSDLPTAKFKHEPLPSRDWIRLLKVNTQMDHGNISCTLNHFDPESRPSYVALSYCWGDLTTKHTIYVNGLVKEVHTNLWRFLRRVCLNKDAKWFWIDSICIDQAHHSERNDQVARMGPIYTEAENVLSWLGECQRGADALKTIVDPQSSADKVSPWSISIRRALFRLLREENYWRRVWVIQEVACARAALVVCGSTAVDFDLLAKQMALRMRDYPSRGGIVELDDWNDHWIFKLLRLREHMKSGRQLRFLDLVKEFSKCDSTKEVDRVYGLLGLADRLDPDFEPTNMEVDYDKTLEQVLWDSLFLMAETIPLRPDIDILSIVAVPYGIRGPEDEVFWRLQSYAMAETTSEKRTIQAYRAQSIYAAIVTGFYNSDPQDTTENMNLHGTTMAGSEGNEGRKESEDLNFELAARAAVKQAFLHAYQHLRGDIQREDTLVQAALVGLFLAIDGITDGLYIDLPPLPKSPAWRGSLEHKQYLDKRIISSIAMKFEGRYAYRNGFRYGEATLMVPEVGVLLHVHEFVEIKRSTASFYCVLCQASNLPNHSPQYILEDLDRKAERARIARADPCVVAKKLDAKDMMALLDVLGDQLQITERIVKAAASNTQGAGVMALLLDKRGDEVQITEDIVKAAARTGFSGKKIMALLLEKRGGQVRITEDVVEAASGNIYGGEEVLELLLDKRGDEVQVTEGVVKAAAGNIRGGKKVLELLLDKKGDQIQVTEGVIKAAARNRRRGNEVIALLLDKKGDQIQVTEGMLKAAARARWSDKVMAFLNEKVNNFRS